MNLEDGCGTVGALSQDDEGGPLSLWWAGIISSAETWGVRRRRPPREDGSRLGAKGRVRVLSWAFLAGSSRVREGWAAQRMPHHTAVGVSLAFILLEMKSPWNATHTKRSGRRHWVNRLRQSRSRSWQWPPRRPSQTLTMWLGIHGHSDQRLCFSVLRSILVVFMSFFPISLFYVLAIACPWRFSRQRILEWVAIPSSRGSSQPRDRTLVSCIAGGFFTSWASREAPKYRIPSYFSKGCSKLKRSVESGVHIKWTEPSKHWPPAP